MREGGFTLLEVLIAIMVLVMAVATILPLFAVGSTSHKRGIDQANLAWLAPRVAARMQEKFYDVNPQEVKGFVREGPNGSLLIEEARGGPARDGAAYTFHAKFTPLSQSQTDLVANTAYHMELTLNYLEAGEGQGEVFHTVLLRRMAR